MENITYDEFKKMDIRVGEIIAAEEIEGADRIYKLKVNLGGEERELVAGIKAFYPKESLPGKKVVVLVNLEPRIIRGVTSQGMILAAGLEDKSDLTVLIPEKNMPNGVKIS
jgi:methionine--tRNA ligase beta chain